MTERDSLLGGPPPLYHPVDPSHNPEYPSASGSSPPLKDNTLPPAQQCPQMEFNTAWAGWKDRGFAIAFWIHCILVIILGFALGIPAVRADARKSFDDPTRTALDYNANLFIRVFVGAAAISGVVAFFAFFVLQRCAGRIIKCSLYMGVAIQILLCITLFIVAWPMGIITLIFVLISLWYIYYVRNRIAFAEAHLQVGCAALRSHPSVLVVALAMLILQFLWILLWSLMALGFEYLANGDGNDKKSSGIGGGIFAIVLLTSLFWGALVFRNVTHFVTACVVGQWWFTADAHRQYAVETSVQRAFTTNFGTISFGSLIIAFIKALRVFAQINEGNARRDGNIFLLLISCCAVCILRIFEGLVRYLNEWALVFSALTGQSFRSASRSFIDLFQQRGWTMIINDDLAGNALTIVTVAIGCISAAIGGVSTYVIMPHSPSRAAIAGMAALFCFTIGIAMGTIMASILSSGVRTAFVCFAMNPTALGATHPEHLQNLLLAWYQFQPQAFAASGFAMHYPKPAGAPSNVYAAV
ncbi:unnamed protein product [Rotaria socialis]|uniref:Choline transporter-like protein n=2 Tax=Rotaria socialis TaxID=392032 RepID=A0A820JQL7_9BILA|nr:unnamed protein product [Rotaria socialis]CAF3322399.1 unnamed protein product [Rotaria socialis]CAF3401775.1 unnamed protein product [Rotaria socialis]CAF3586433.1 unnamed protein product [Rotaria socialis]CAF3757776.1 unnamed protein product [Rotaria socialis]